MNLANRLARGTLFAAVAAAAFTVGSSNAAEHSVRIVELPRVTVVAQRLPVQMVALQHATVRVVDLPRVVVVAKRSAPTETVLAQRTARLAGI